MGLTILFIHLKIILLQYFQFQFSVSAKISSIQTDPVTTFLIVNCLWHWIPKTRSGFFLNNSTQSIKYIGSKTDFSIHYLNVLRWIWLWKNLICQLSRVQYPSSDFKWLKDARDHRLHPLKSTVGSMLEVVVSDVLVH